MSLRRSNRSLMGVAIAVSVGISVAVSVNHHHSDFLGGIIVGLAFGLAILILGRRSSMCCGELHSPRKE